MSDLAGMDPLVAQFLLEQSLVGLYVIQGDRFAYVNDRFAEIFGYSVAEIVGSLSVADLVAPRDRHRVSENIAKRLDGETEVIEYSFDASHRDGSTLHVEVHGARVDLSGAAAVIGILIDRTKGVQAERHALHLQKLEATGRLAAGIAHDFRNVLNSIGVTAALLRRENLDDDRSEDLDHILAAVDRGSRLSEQLMRLNLESPPSVAPISITEHVRALQPMLARLLKEGLSLDLDLDLGAQLPPLHVDPGHIEQVLMNLVLNAVDAMSEQGRILVSVCASDESAAGAGPCICLRVQDTGPGIPSEIRDRIFEPYFTTKADKGTGLGLANVQAIARRYGGMARVESAHGNGTTVAVMIPTTASRA